MASDECLVTWGVQHFSKEAFLYWLLAWTMEYENQYDEEPDEMAPRVVGFL